MGLGFYLLSLKDVSMNGTLGSFSKVARRGELTRLCSSIVRCHPPYIESSSALGTRVTPTPLEQKIGIRIFIVGGRETRWECRSYANSWLVERYFWLTFKVMGIEMFISSSSFSSILSLGIKAIKPCNVCFSSKLFIRLMFWIQDSSSFLKDTFF